MRYYRKIIKIKAEDSPNVRLGLAQRRAGQPVTGEILVPGVLTIEEYDKRRAVWDVVRQCVGLDAEFYKGAEVLLFPPVWLNRAEAIADLLRGKVVRRARGIGIDPAEGGDSTAMAAVDELGLIELVSKKTPNTAIILGEAIAFMRKHGCEATNICWDQGGGGKQHADAMRQAGWPVRTVPFGSPIDLPIKRGLHTIESRKDMTEERYEYVNRRAEMYGEFSQLLDEHMGPRYFKLGMNDAWGIPSAQWGDQYKELRRQLAPLPKLYDDEGRMYMYSKNKKSRDSKEMTLQEMLGCSPDETDAVLLAIHAMLHKSRQSVAGGM